MIKICMEDEEILINQLFAGSYLNEGANIGHEIVNLFKDDNGNNYLYITPSGIIDMHSHPVKSIIFVRNIKSKTTVEVVAKAEELSPVNINPENIKYAGTPIEHVFSNNIYHEKDDPGIFFTFKANKIRTPKNGHRIMLTIDKNFTINDKSIHLIRLHSNNKVISNQSGRKYYSSQKDHDAYIELKNLLKNDRYWEPKNTTKKLFTDGSAHKTSPTFLEIIRKDNDELIFSNLLAYYFQYNRTVFQKFTSNILGVKNFTPNFNIIRESNSNIDLWIEDDKHILIIENKIKSGLNGLKNGNYSQLNKYQEYTEKRIKNPEDNSYGKESHYYIFTPNYNHIDTSNFNLEKPYQIIHYDKIYDFFCSNATNFIDERYFSDFLKGLRNHTISMSELNFSIMRSRFLEKINHM